MINSYTYELRYDEYEDVFILGRNYHDHVRNPPSHKFNTKHDLLEFLKTDWFSE